MTKAKRPTLPRAWYAICTFAYSLVRIEFRYAESMSINFGVKLRSIHGAGFLR